MGEMPSSSSTEEPRNLGHLGEDVGARRLLSVLPEGNILLALAEEMGELGLSEAGGEA